MKEQTHYYLIGNEIKKGNKIPTTHYNHPEYNQIMMLWKNSLQPCSITDVEFQKILAYCYSQNPNFNTPIEVTDIVKVDCDGINTVVTFREPKSEANSSLNNTLQWCLNYINKQKDSDEKTALIKELNAKSEANEAVDESENKYHFAREILFTLRVNRSINETAYLHWIDKLIQDEKIFKTRNNK